MWAVKLFSNAKALYKEINSATLTGAIDVVAVEQEDGTYNATPFHVRFGKLGVIRSKEKVVYIEINGEPCDICMKLGDDGEAFFVEDAEEQNELPPHLATSPIPTDTECEPIGASGGCAMEKPAELSRVLSDSMLFIPERDQRERHVSEGSSSKGAAGNSLPMPACLPQLSALVHDTPATSATNYFAPIVGAVPTPSRPACAAEDGEALKADASGTEEGRNISGMMPQPAAAADFALPSIGKGEDYATQRSRHGSLHDDNLPMTAGDQHTFEWLSASSTMSYRPHPFSDTDATPGTSPQTSRPVSPKSDTEVEVSAAAAAAATAVTDTGGLQQWNWGELPRSAKLPQDTHPEMTFEFNSKAKEDNKLNTKPAADENVIASTAIGGSTSGSSTSGGLLSFMRKAGRSKPAEEQGIYLDDLKLDKMDPEVAALYFPKRGSHELQKEAHPSLSTHTVRDEDAESGKGVSLPQSPLTVLEPHPTAAAVPAALPARNEMDAAAAAEQVLHRPEFRMFGDVAMSLCGGLKDADTSITMDKFMHHLVTFEDFCKDPNIFSNPNLVIRMHEKFLNWKVAAPIMMSLMAFNLPLPDDTVNALMKQHMPKVEERKRGMFSSWWSSKSKIDVPKETMAKTDSKDSAKATMAEPVALGDSKETSPGAAVVAPVPPDHAKQHQQELNAAVLSIDSGDEADDETTSGDIRETGVKSTASAERPQKSREPHQYRFKKTLRLSSERLKTLKLHEGCNEIEYSVTTALQGTTRCTSHVYLWKYNDKIVVSDIDGTITRSDVLGQLLPMVGKDWSQGGVVQLYTRISANGYKFVYLSARAIGQAQITRDYLRSVRQQQAPLPPGPIFLSPTSLVNAFHKEVIERKPEEFKISCLRDLKSLFPSSLSMPLYAGFGNKINDVWAYRAVDIPITRIFTINPKGELRHELSQTFLSSYMKLSDVADHYFPPVHALGGQEPVFEPGHFSSFTYWRQPLPNIIEDLP